MFYGNKVPLTRGTPFTKKGSVAERGGFIILSRRRKIPNPPLGTHIPHTPSLQRPDSPVLQPLKFLFEKS